MPNRSWNFNHHKFSISFKRKTLFEFSRKTNLGIFLFHDDDEDNGGGGGDGDDFHRKQLSPEI